MKFPEPLSINWLANFIDAKVIGNSSLSILGINEIHRVEAGDIVFVDHPKYYDKCLQSNANFIIINSNEVKPPENKVLFVVDDPFECYLKIVTHFKPFKPSTEAISSTALIGENSIIMPGVFIGHDVTIGSNCVIHPNVVIHPYTQIGNNCVIQSGTVIGSDAFYYNSKKNRPVWYKRMKSCGHVVIHDNVEIGANCTIDRGVTATTEIGRGTIIDNLVHIGHDNLIGENCLLAAQVGVAGGTVIESGVCLWGQVGVNKTIKIGQNASVMGQSGVVGNLAGNKTYWGTPALDIIEKKKELVWIKRIQSLWQKHNEKK